MYFHKLLVMLPELFIIPQQLTKPLIFLKKNPFHIGRSGKRWIFIISPNFVLNTLAPFFYLSIIFILFW